MLALFGVVLVFIVYVPVKFIKWVEPDFLPYRVFAISDEPLNHVSLELVTLQGELWIRFRQISFQRKIQCSYRPYWNRRISKSS